jgi:hypothetical protein
MYNLICNETNEPLKDADGNPVVYATGNECGQAMQAIRISTGKRYRPARVIDQNWRNRELAKSLSGEYTIPAWFILKYHQIEKTDRFTGNKTLAWVSTDHIFSEDRERWYMTDEPVKQRNIALPVIPFHFLHVSKLDSSKVAYTKDEESGSADRQTQTTVGRYLTAYYPDLDNELIKYINALHQQAYQPINVQFATGEQITEIYKSCHDTGLSSCMTKPDSRYASFCHPTLVYSAGDLSLAYLTDADGHITARALVWQDKKTYTRIYGNYETLGAGLKTLGYSSDGDFHQAKIKRIDDENEPDRLVLPYLDGIQTVSCNSKEWVIIDKYGDIDASSQDGLQKPTRYAVCDSCEDDIHDEDEAYTVYTRRHSTVTWCQYCRDQESFWCEGTQEWVRNDREVTVDGQSYSYWYVEDNANRCEYSDEYTFEDTVTVYTSETDTEEWLEAIADDESFICRVTGNRYTNRLQVIDDWADEPRAICNEPDDQPEPEMIICARPYQSGFACAA